jgi:hypothetical protein
MSLPPPPVVASIGSLNPVEALITSVNTNTYFIGMSMILLNLGGRHLAPSLTSDQDKFFQNPWIRRGMLFVVIFVATRNIFTAFWLSIGLILIMGYLFNEHSSLYLFGEPIPVAAVVPVPTTGLTPDEQDIYKKLHDKVNRSNESKETEKKKDSIEKQMTTWYKKNMDAVQKFLS